MSRATPETPRIVVLSAKGSDIVVPEGKVLVWDP